MKVIFLDFDGVINSCQSATFWHNKRKQENWENDLYKEWQGSLREYIAQEFCPIALSNVEQLMRMAPDLKIVVSSTWRLGETVESLKKILYPAKLIADAIIDVTPSLNPRTERGNEIQHWLDRNPEVTDFAIIDDDCDMVHLTDKLIRIDNRVGFQWPNIYDTLKRLNIEVK